MAVKSPEKSLYSQFCDYMERETRGVEIGVYTISGILFAVACHRIRPITKFRHPSQIPSHFIRNKLKQFGRVESVEPSQTAGPLLRINHKPLINIFLGSKETLPVKIAGVTVNPNGLSWLQGVTVDRRVEFIPLFTHSEAAECVVFVMPTEQEKRLKKNPRSLDVAEALLSLGFAQTTGVPAEVPLSDKKMRDYYKLLTYVEKKAKNRREGLWSAKVPPPIWPLRLLQDSFDRLITSLLPESRRLPQLVR
uniref:TNase-like domain-containing protein n=1 Tax=Phlebotomus papatasi TaxID=29031 RepID=A0A1B0DMQ5_PHLPP